MICIVCVCVCLNVCIYARSVNKLITLIVSIGRVFVLLPPNLAVLVLIVVLPVFVHIVFNVPPLPVLDPIVQLCVAHIAILVSVNAVYNLPVGRACVFINKNKIIYLCLSFQKCSCKLFLLWQQELWWNMLLCRNISVLFFFLIGV